MQSAQSGVAQDAPARQYAPGSSEVVDLTNAVGSVRPSDLEVPQEIVEIASYTVPMLLSMVRRKEILPPMLVLKREGDESYAFEAIEEPVKTQADMLGYMQRRIENDRKMAALRDGAPVGDVTTAGDVATAGDGGSENLGDSGISGAADGLGNSAGSEGSGARAKSGTTGTEEPFMPITAYGCLLDERMDGFSAGEAESFGATPQDNQVLRCIFGCSASSVGVMVRQRFSPKLFGGANLLGAPMITSGPPSLLV